MRTTSEELIRRYRARGWWDDTRIGDLYAQAAGQDPARPAAVDPFNRATIDGAEPLRLDYAGLDALIGRTLLALHAAGLRRDDVLVVQLPNVVEYVALYIAASRAGVILSPVPMQYRGHELDSIIALTGARALLTVARCKDSAPAEAALALAARPTVLVLGRTAPAGALPFAPRDLPAADAAQLAAIEVEAGVGADDIVTVCWTSGTEGLPKGVPRSHNHWLAISHAHFAATQLRTGDRLLNPFPLVNMAAIGGCLLSWLRCAGTLILHHPFELPVWLQQIHRERPDYAIAPPAILQMLLQNEALLEGIDLGSLRCIGSGSAPLPPAMIRSYQARHGIEIVNLFGSNEGVSLASGPTEVPDPEERARFFPRFGRPELHWPQRVSALMETKIVDPAGGGEITAPGVPGELLIRGATVFDGYYRAPALTAEAFTADGYFRTGDLFEIGGAGARYYRFVGRLKQIIVRGGVKISPDEVDAVLSGHPDIAELAVVGVPDEIMGERVCAVIVPRPGATPTLAQLQDYARERGLAPFKWPERLSTVARLPRNPLGKVIRPELETIARAAMAG